jgi:hypothetical protein
MSSPPTIVRVTEDDLRIAVKRLLACNGFFVRADDVRITRSEHASSCSLYEVDLLDNELLLPPLLLKDLSPWAQIPEAVGVRPSHIYDPLREIAVYTRMLEPCGIGVGFYGGAFDRRSGHSVLLIERADALELDHIGELEKWQRAAREIGEMHRRYPERALPPKLRRHLIAVDGANFGSWIDRAARTTASSGALAPIVERRESLARELDTLPRVFAHGELFASNVLVDDEHVYPIDWELASVAPGALDIAALTAGAWSDDERSSLVEAYREGLGVMGLWSRSELERGASDRAIDLARLYLAVRLIGWSDKWTPPEDEQHDWLAEALEAFERLRQGD